MSHVDPLVELSQDPKHWSIYALLSAWAECTPSAGPSLPPVVRRLPTAVYVSDSKMWWRP